VTMTTTPAGNASSTTIGQAINAWAAAAAAGGGLGYDPTKFYCRATDARGHGEKISGKIPPDLYAQICALVFSPDFPDYTMPMDFVRDAIVHQLQARQSQIGDPAFREAIDSALRRLAFDEFSLRMAEDVDRWEKSEERLREALTALRGAKAWGQLYEYLKHGEELADPLPEPYRTGILNLIEEWKPLVPEEFKVDGWG